MLSGIPEQKAFAISNPATLSLACALGISELAKPLPTSLVEELGFGSGPKAYALMQYVMAAHENDPLCMEYTSSAMMNIWKAAGLDLSNVPGAGKMPMSLPSA